MDAACECPRAGRNSTDRCGPRWPRGPNALRACALVRPFAIDVPVQGAWYAVCTPERLQVPRVRMCMDWLGRRLAVPTVTLATFIEDAG